MTLPQPMLRWAGGKRQLLKILTASFPNDFDLSKNTYFEPFLGSGALFFAFASFLTPSQLLAINPRSNSFVLSDTNKELINFYTVVRNNPDLLIETLMKMANKKSELDYYQVRGSAPQNKVEKAARLLYLNRLCFNGLYRVNSRGEFNVPFGRLKNPVICNSQQILACSSWLKNSKLKAESFGRAVQKAKRGDLAYFDPPYIPLSDTSSFSSYAKEGFGENDQRELAQTIEDLTKKQVNVILSNSDTPQSRKIFGNLTLFSISANRSISAAGGSRKRVQELIGINFPVPQMRNPLLMKQFELY